MLLSLWLLQALPVHTGPVFHLTQPRDWVEAGHVAPYARAVLGRSRAELADVGPPPSSDTDTPRDIRLWRPAGTALALDGMSRLARRGGPRRARETIPPMARVWPTLPEPRADALLPHRRIIAYYGNPKSTQMGILGAYPPAEMMARLERTAAEWTAADPGTPAAPALHLTATVAHGRPGADGKYRIRHGADVIEQVIGWAATRGWLVFLDIQPGQSTVEAELPRLLPYLARPNVHLALDPEFSMKDGRLPGKYIGTLDAREVNYAVGVLERLVDSLHLPPKVVVVHRFTVDMLTNARSIRVDPEGR